MHFNFKNYISKTSNTILSLKQEEAKIKNIADEILKIRNKGNKILLAGNGGSCSDVEHFGGELICTFSKRNRNPISTQVLTNHSAAMTAWGNDFNFKTYFERQIEANGKKGDLLIVLSTGGGNLSKDISTNLILAAKKAKKMGIKIVSLVGKSGGYLYKNSNISIKVKSNETATIQEAHMTILHSICYFLESKL
jgi:D-sedoheptulose 7-phosphate isomerase